jgi:rhodanese-related sulfurtransferase
MRQSRANQSVGANAQRQVRWSSDRLWTLNDSDEQGGTMIHPRRRSIDQLLLEARSRLVRLTPHQALEAQRDGATLVDIRPQANRDNEGQLPGALVIERTVLEWRLDPASPDGLPLAAYDLYVILVCNDGYASSLAAAMLQDLGVRCATDLEGGFRAWKAAGLPVRAVTPY